MPDVFSFLSILIFTFFFTTLNAGAQIKVISIHQNKQPKHTVSFATKHQFTYLIINDKQRGFGYDIFYDKHKIIHQPSVPGLQGNNGFTTKQDAIKIARLAINKLKNNITPPTITRKELDSLQIKL